MHRGQHDEVIARRQETLDAAKTAHPERFVNGPPRAKPLADAVYINKPKSDNEIQVEAHSLNMSAAGLKIVDTYRREH